MPIHKKKRAFEKGRPAANTKLVSDPNDRRVREVRVRGGNRKYRALRLSEGNFAWASEGIAKKTRITNVIYNASNNELVRTNTLVKGAIVQIDATPFRQWYNQHYGVDLSHKKAAVAQTADKKKTATDKPVAETKAAETVKKSKHALAKQAFRTKERVIDSNLESQFGQQRILAVLSSRPGQSGRADGYILEGKELEFYVRKIETKKK